MLLTRSPPPSQIHYNYPKKNLKIDIDLGGADIVGTKCVLYFF